MQRAIGAFAEEQGVEQAYVQIELADGARFALHTLSPDPGFGFVTIQPHAQDEPDVPGKLIVPVGFIRRIELDRAEEQRAALGFTPSVP